MYSQLLAILLDYTCKDRSERIWHIFSETMRKKHETFNKGWESLSLDSNSGMLTQDHCRLNKPISSGFKFRINTDCYDHILVEHVAVYSAPTFRRNLLSTPSRVKETAAIPVQGSA